MPMDLYSRWRHVSKGLVPPMIGTQVQVRDAMQCDGRLEWFLATIYAINHHFTRTREIPTIVSLGVATGGLIPW